MEALRERFGKYHVLEKIAQGGMAEVYKVKTVGIAGFEKIQALKRILPRQAREARFIRSFIDEARIAVELTHRNIVQVFDFGKADGELFLAMELIEGKDLRTTMEQAVSRDALPPVAIAAYIISEVASGLDYAHRKADGYGGSLGIVHCDVSPSNVMLSTEGDIKILDFGIARATFASALERRRLRGKPRYMAPEQTIGEIPSAASDVFALGIIAWELMTGLALYRGGDLKAILDAVRRLDPPRVDRLNPHVPGEIADAVAVALAREPAHRGTAADLASACARTAMQAGARALARWLAELAARPSRTVIPWQPEVTSISVSPDSADDVAALSIDDELPTARPSPARGLARREPPVRPSLTMSLGDAPLPPVRPSLTMSLGDPPYPAARPSTTISLGDPALPVARPSTTIALGDPALPVARPSTTIAMHDLPSAVDRAASFIDRPPLSMDPAIPRMPRHGSQGAAEARDRLGKLDGADAWFAEPQADATAAADAAPVIRRSYERLEVAPGAPPSGARLDDDLTNRSFVLPPSAPDDTSYDELDAEPEPSATGEPHTAAIGDAPIDDDLGVLAAGALAERRRIVIVAGLLAGAAPDALRPVTKSLGELAYQRGGVVLESTPESLVVAFGLEVAGEDDVAIAMGWALDAAAMARDTAADGETVQVRIGARAGVTTASSPASQSSPSLQLPASQSSPALRPPSSPGLLPPPSQSSPSLQLPVSQPSPALRPSSSPGLLPPPASQSSAALVPPASRSQSSPALVPPASRLQSSPALVPPASQSSPALVPPAGVAPTVTVTSGPDGAPRIPQDAIDEARALARDAAPDRPLFVGGAGRITSSLYALREQPARRIGRRSRVIEVLGPRGFDERDRARLERRGKFVGRTAQLAELEVWYHRAIAADRRLCVLITGAAGTGKSRLIAELVARCTAAGTAMRVTTTAASPASRLAPFATVIDLYQAALGLPPTRGRGARAQVVHRLYHLMMNAGMSTDRARAVTTDLDRAMELRDGLGVGAREVADLRPRISAGLAAFRTISRDRPALTVVEDIHLADSASLEALRHTLAMPAYGPELLVLTARPEGLPPLAADVVLTIGDLAGAELRALVIDRLGDAATPLAIATVLARGGGNPLFVEELAQAVRDAGAAGEDVPATARDVVSARIDRLPARAKAALRFASVLGGTVRARLLEELLGEGSLDSELDELVAAGFLVRPDSAAGSSEGEVQFARGLVREVVYESLSARAQRDTHARVGRLLASRFFAGREEPPAAIAEHLERGGEPAGAAAFWLRAGRLALSASDADAAIACFTRTLGLERELGEPPPTQASKARRREALAGRDEARRLQGDLTSDPGDLDELARLCAGEPARLADVAIRRAQRMLRLGDYARASDATVAAEHHATAARDDRLRGEALRVRGEILERVGRFDDALVVVGAALELFHRQRAIADEMAAMVGRGRIHLLRAHYEAARDAYRPVLELIDQTGDPWLERIVKNHVAVIEMCLGNFAAAMQCAQRSLELCRRYGDRGREGDALSVAGIVLLEVGLYEPAAAMFADALDLLSRTNSRWSRADCLIYAGICEQRRGRPGGLEMLDEALADARRLGARYLEANALVARAAVHLRAGALAAAIADASAGAAVAREATLVGYEIQGLARHALALSRLGNRTAEAGALVHRALDLLDAQQYLEGSEEEVLVACASVLSAAGGGDRSNTLLERGRASASRKLAALPDPEWRAAYAAIPEIAALLG